MAQARSQRFVAWLGEASGDAAALGGKGASLDRLARLGFRVPPGFCLTTAAFRAQLESLPVPGEHHPTDELGVEIAVSPIHPAILRELEDGLARLEQANREPGWTVRLAVRSSAIGEDGSLASYAGLHETELDRTIGEVPGAVRRCWASLWSAPALAYRARRGLPLDEAAMAVVVQQLVPADAAAVAFTRHPVTGNHDQLVVTAVRGLGDAMVSGTVTPDTFVIDRADPSNVEITRGDDPEQSIDVDTLRELVETCLAVEAAYGHAVDVEAALAGGRWYLLQARPITTGGPGAGTAPEAASAGAGR
jgi:phosphoenolpyruvate synthase/pyruvate phosphate dikinase